MSPTPLVGTIQEVIRCSEQGNSVFHSSEHGLSSSLCNNFATSEVSRSTEVIGTQQCSYTSTPAFDHSTTRRPARVVAAGLLNQASPRHCEVYNKSKNRRLLYR